MNRACSVLLVGFAAWAAAWQPDPAAMAHRYYQNQFDNLEPVKDGRMGVSRLETTEHLGNRLSYHLPKVGMFDVSVAIYSNRGQPLDGKSLQRRYARGKDQPPEPEAIAKRAAVSFRKGRLQPIRENLANGYVEARPFILTSEKCVKCHRGMKVGDPVAVGVYTAVRKPER